MTPATVHEDKYFITHPESNRICHACNTKYNIKFRGKPPWSLTCSMKCQKKRTKENAKNYLREYMRTYGPFAKSIKDFTREIIKKLVFEMIGFNIGASKIENITKDGYRHGKRQKISCIYCKRKFNVNNIKFHQKHCKEMIT